MRRRIVLPAALAGLALFVSGIVRGAGSNATEEAAIRKIVAAGQMPPSLPDRIQWSGATTRPVVGNERPQTTLAKELFPIVYRTQHTRSTNRFAL